MKKKSKLKLGLDPCCQMISIQAVLTQFIKFRNRTFKNCNMIANLGKIAKVSFQVLEMNLFQKVVWNWYSWKITWGSLGCISEICNWRISILRDHDIDQWRGGTRKASVDASKSYMDITIPDWNLQPSNISPTLYRLSHQDSLGWNRCCSVNW